MASVAAPRTERGARTRAALVGAARTVFERDGFLGARIADIAAQAGCATGSFYTYFADKDEAFTAVIDEVQHEMLHPRLREVEAEDDPIAVIEAANRAYLDAYRRNARLMALMEQVAAIDEGFRRWRRQRAAAFSKRNAASIRRLQCDGLADPALDPLLAARALSGMVSRMAYQTFVGGDATPFEELVATVTRLWANALRITSDARATA